MNFFQSKQLIKEEPAYFIKNVQFLQDIHKKVNLHDYNSYKTKHQIHLLLNTHYNNVHMLLDMLQLNAQEERDFRMFIYYQIDMTNIISYVVDHFLFKIVSDTIIRTKNIKHCLSSY